MNYKEHIMCDSMYHISMYHTMCVCVCVCVFEHLP
jgi:hypothetical protein